MAKSNAPRLEISIEAITTGLKKGLEEARKELKAFSDEAKKASSSDFKNALNAEKLALAEVRTESAKLASILKSSLSESLNNAKRATEQSKQATESYKQATESSKKSVIDHSKALVDAKVATENERTALANTRSEIAKLALAKRQSQKETQAASGSYREAQQRLTALGAAIRNAQGGFNNTTPAIRAQIKEYNELNAKLKAFDAQMGNHQRQVGNYALGMGNATGVTMEFTRIIQDAPYGMMGIGNNIQQLTANWQQYVKSSQEAAAAQGKTVTTGALLRNALSSMISPASLLTLGIAALTSGWVLYDKWQQKSKKSTDETKKSLTEYIDTLNGVSRAQANGQVSALKELTTVEQLYRATQNLSIPMKERIQYANELIKKGGDLFKSTNAESIVAGKASEAYDRLTNSIKQTAMAQAFMQKMTENASKVLSNNLDVVNEANEIMKLNQQIAKKQSVTTVGRATGAVGESVESSNINILNKLYEEREQRVKRINELNKDNSETLKEQNLLQKGINSQLEKGAKITDGVGGKEKKKGKTQAELIKEANEALATGQVRALEGIDGEMAKIDAKWDSINDKINKINDSSLKKQKLGLSAIGRETEKYNKFLEIFSKSPLKQTREGIPIATSGVLNTPSSLPLLGLNQERLNRPILSKGLEDDFTKQFQSTLRRGLSNVFNDLFSDITSMSQENYNIEKKYAELRRNATQSQIEGLNKMEALERKINNGLTNIISKLGGTFTSIGGNMLSSALSTGIASADFEDLSKMFSGDNKAVGYGSLGSLAGGLLQGSLKKTDVVGQTFGGLLAGAGTGAALGSVVPVLGTAVGAAVGAVIGGLSGFFNAKSAKKQEELAELQLAEQRKLVALQERQALLAYTSSVIGQQTNAGIVTSVDRDEFGNLVSRVKGSDLELVIERSKSSR